MVHLHKVFIEEECVSIDSQAVYKSREDPHYSLYKCYDSLYLCTLEEYVCASFPAIHMWTHGARWYPSSWDSHAPGTPGSLYRDECASFPATSTHTCTRVWLPEDRVCYCKCYIHQADWSFLLLYKLVSTVVCWKFILQLTMMYKTESTTSCEYPPVTVKTRIETMYTAYHKPWSLSSSVQIYSVELVHSTT